MPRLTRIKISVEYDGNDNFITSGIFCTIKDAIRHLKRIKAFERKVH